MVCNFPIPSWMNWCHVWSLGYHRGSTCFLWCQNSLQQHHWIDCYDWSIVFSWSTWSSWSSGQLWAAVYLLHAAGICLGNIQARTHAQLALASEQSLIHAQRRLRLSMQHVFGHSGKLGNECADHAAARGTFGLTCHNNVTRWVHHNFDATMCFDDRKNISWVLERLEHIQTMQHHFFQTDVSVDFLIGFFVCLCNSRELKLCVSLQVLPSGFFFPQRVMDRLSSSASTVPSMDDYFEHNMRNPLLELLFVEQDNDFVVSYLLEMSVAEIELSCHFALHLLCYKDMVLASAWWFTWHHRWWRSFQFCASLAVTALLRLARGYNTLVYIFPPPGGLVYSRFHTIFPQGWHSMFPWPDDDLKSSLYPRRPLRWSVSMMIWVKLIYPTGASSSDALVVMRTWTFNIFFSSEESSQTSTDFSTNTFFKVSLFGIQFIYNRLSETLFFFLGAVKCWCGTIVITFSQDPWRDSQDICFFPSWLYLLDDCPCHLVRVTFTLATGKGAKIVRWCPLGLSHYLSPYFGFLWKGAALLNCLSFVLFTRCLLDVSSFLGLRLRPSARVCRCHWDPLTLGRLGIDAGSRAWSSPFPLFGSAPVTSVSWLQTRAPYSTTYSGYAWTRLKSNTSCCFFVCLVRGSRFDELPQDCSVVLCLC